MARTGISITVSNTVLGSTPQVNANSMLIVEGAEATTTGVLAFSLGVPYMLQSVNDLTTLGIDATNNPDIVNQVTDFYTPRTGINNTGTILWLIGIASDIGEAVTNQLADWVRATVAQGFQFRPRNILISINPEAWTDASPLTPTRIQTVIDELYVEGFSTVAIIGEILRVTEGVDTTYSTLPDLSTYKAGMVGTVVFTNRQGDRACVGAVGGFMSTLSVGTSIGDASLAAFGTTFYFTDTTASGTAINTPCSRLSLTAINTLGDKQYIFARTRPPRNGLWINDGATAEEATTALSTLEAGRTIASIVDDLRDFLTPYINNRIPVNSDGDIQSTYREVVISSARSTVIQPYIASGDISDARISLVAKNNDMVGTRTWEVTLEILPAPTLRWIDAFVFYVNSL